MTASDPPPSASSPPPAYRALPPGAVVEVELPPLTALFDRRSGQTHLLASPLPELLALLAEAPGPLSVDALARALKERFAILDAGDDASERAVIAARLAELAALRLVAVARPLRAGEGAGAGAGAGGISCATG